MPCCGQNRQRAARSGIAHASPRPEQSAPQKPAPMMTKTPAGSGAVTIHNKQRTLVEVQGPATGQRYRFEAGGMQAVDKRDAERLIATGMFGRVWS